MVWRRSDSQNECTFCNFGSYRMLPWWEHGISIKGGMVNVLVVGVCSVSFEKVMRSHGREGCIIGPHRFLVIRCMCNYGFGILTLISSHCLTLVN